jgi:hypothetical protein
MHRLYRLVGQGRRIQFLAGAKIFFSLHSSKAGSRACTVDTGGSFLELK